MIKYKYKIEQKKGCRTMEELYLILNESLKNQYGLNALITLLETLEASYSEEKEMEIKSLTNVIKVYLEALQEDVSNTISLIDNYIVKESQNRK